MIARSSEEIQSVGRSNYLIVWGDTLWAISEASGLSVDALVQINNIVNRDLIYAGNPMVLDGNKITVVEQNGQKSSFLVEGNKVTPTENHVVHIAPAQPATPTLVKDEGKTDDASNNEVEDPDEESNENSYEDVPILEEAKTESVQEAYDNFRASFSNNKYEILILDRDKAGHDIFIGGYITDDGTGYLSGEEVLLESDYINFKEFFEDQGYTLNHHSLNTEDGINFAFWMIVEEEQEVIIEVEDFEMIEPDFSDVDAVQEAYERFQLFFPEGKHGILIAEPEVDGYDLYIGGHISNDGSSYDHGDEELLEEDYYNYKDYLESRGYEIVLASCETTGGLHYAFHVNVQ